MPKKVLVCGATGFIGKNVSKFLASKPEYNVTGTYLKSDPFESPDIRFVRADLTVRSEVQKVVQDAEIVIHAAAITSGFLKYKAESDVTDNIIMNSLIIQSCFDFNVEHFLYPSCTILYPSSSVPVGEDGYDPTQQIHPKYFLGARMKKMAEDMCYMFSQSDLCSTKFTAFRHSNVYGSYDKYDLDCAHVCAATITKVMNATDGDAVHIFGTGEDERDLLHIDDLVGFVVKAIENQSSRFELLNVGYGSCISIKDLCQKIINISGKKGIQIECELPSGAIEPTKVCLDCSKAKESVGWVCGLSLDEGLERAINWYSRHGDVA